MIKHWLKKPYFFISDVKTVLKLSATIGTFIFLFLYIFEPFGMYGVYNDTLFYPLGFGLITFFTTILAFICMPLLFENTFSNDSWTVGKNIIFLVCLVLSIAIFNWFYNINVQVTDKQSPLITFKEMVSYTFTLGCFPVLFYMYVSEKIYREKRVKTSGEIMKYKVPKVDENGEDDEKVLNFTGNNKDENISFSLHDLIYISSQGNYASFFINSNTGVKELVLRNTLTNITSDLTSYKNIIRCHKSYIINTNYVDAISGNARGYFLTTTITTQKIPVSRKFSKENLKKLIN